MLAKSNGVALKQSYQAQFGGLNHTKGATDGDIYDMRNMTSDHYPVLSPRGRRRTVATYDTIYGLYCYGEHTFIAAEKNGDCGLYINGEKVMALEPSEKQMEVCNKKLIIFPDKVYYDLNALDAVGSVANKSALNELTGSKYGEVYLVEKVNYYDSRCIYYWNGSEWILFGPEADNMSAKVGPITVSFESGELYGNVVNNNAMRLYGIVDAKIARLFRPGDAVTISGATEIPSNNKTAIIREVNKTTLCFYPDTFTTTPDYYTYTTKEELLLPKADGTSTSEIRYYCFYNGVQQVTFRPPAKGIPKGYLLEWYVGESVLKYYAPGLNEAEGEVEVITYGPDGNNEIYYGAIAAELKFVAHYEFAQMESSVTIERVIPDFDFILEVNNRLWGAKGDTVWGSKLDDPLNWNCFEGLSTDSYSLTLGSPGDITGVANYNGYPTFFKEDGIYKLYGAYPSAYQMYATTTNGVKKDCGKSVTKIGDALYFVSKNGVMAYSGGIPIFIGEPLGVRIVKACGGTDGRKYYLSAYDGAEWRLYVYDTYLGLWHIEDNIEAVAMSYGEELVCAGADTAIRTLGTVDGATEGDFDWSVVFADGVVGSPNKKGVCKALLRADCSGGGYCDVYVSFDGDAPIHMGRIENKGKTSHTLPIVLNRGDHFSISIVGRGIVDIYGLSYFYYHGSEV